jgi:8-oxo-dGTP pyrophosphatase MutT (NUDIX family)
VSFEGSYLWRLRQKIGSELVLVPAAQVLAFDGAGRLLLIKRGDTRRWGLPAGGAEPGATFELTAIRELEEETGLLAEPGDLEAFACVSDPDMYDVTLANGDRVHSFGMCFAVHRWAGTPRPDGDESLEVGFFADLPEPRHHHVDTTLALWQTYRETGRFQTG